MPCSSMVSTGPGETSEGETGPTPGTSPVWSASCAVSRSSGGTLKPSAAERWTGGRPGESVLLAGWLGSWSLLSTCPAARLSAAAFSAASRLSLSLSWSLSVIGFLLLLLLVLAFLTGRTVDDLRAGAGTRRAAGREALAGLRRLRGVLAIGASRRWSAWRSGRGLRRAHRDAHRVHLHELGQHFLVAVDEVDDAAGMPDGMQHHLGHFERQLDHHRRRQQPSRQHALRRRHGGADDLH